MATIVEGERRGTLSIVALGYSAGTFAPAHENCVNTSDGQSPLGLTRWANVCMKLVSGKSWKPWA